MTGLVVETGDVDLHSSLAPFLMLQRDPTVRLTAGVFERATVTPEGPGTISVTWDAPRPEAVIRTSGEGGSWLLEQAPAMLGLTDDVGGFAPATAPLRTLWRRYSGNRITASGTLWHDLAWFILQQRVTRSEASVAWSRLVHGLGTPAPGPGTLIVPPGPVDVARLTYERLHRFGIERQRAENLIAAARCVHRLDQAPTLDQDTALTALSAVRGIGPWTTSCLSTFTWGSADTVITGDAGIPSMVSWLLAGERRGNDDRMLELLEPYRPHRYRVIRLVFAAGIKPPRRAPHAPIHDIRKH